MKDNDTEVQTSRKKGFTDQVTIRIDHIKSKTYNIKSEGFQVESRKKT